MSFEHFDVNIFYVYKSTDHGKLHAVDLLVRHIGRVKKSIRGVALLPPTRLRG